jgi:hypothetical protein
MNRNIIKVLLCFIIYGCNSNQTYFKNSQIVDIKLYRYCSDSKVVLEETITDLDKINQLLLCLNNAVKDKFIKFIPLYKIEINCKNKSYYVLINNLAMSDYRGIKYNLKNSPLEVFKSQHPH